MAGSTCFSRIVGVSVVGENIVKEKLDISIVKIYILYSHKRVSTWVY